jgi:hypothetical protein
LRARWEEFLRAQGEAVPKGDRSLVANDELHKRLMELAGTAVGHQYQSENVIGDPDQIFGIEIEFDGANPTEGPGRSTTPGSPPAPARSPTTLAIDGQGCGIGRPLTGFPSSRSRIPIPNLRRAKTICFGSLNPRRQRAGGEEDAYRHADE